MFKSNMRPIAGPLSSYNDRGGQSDEQDATASSTTDSSESSSSPAPSSNSTRKRNKALKLPSDKLSTSVDSPFLSILMNRRVFSNLLCSLASKIILHPLGVITINKQVYGNSLNIWTMFKSDGIYAFLKGIDYNVYIFIPQALLGISTLVLLAPYRKILDSYFISHLLINIGLYPFHSVQNQKMILDLKIVDSSSLTLDSSLDSTTQENSRKLLILPQAKVYSKSMLESLVDGWHHFSLFNLTKNVYNSINFTGLSVKLLDLTLYYFLNKYVKKLLDSQLETVRKGAWKSLTIALLSTFIPLLITHPIETIHRRIQVHSFDKSSEHHSMSVVGAMKDIRKSGGYLSFYNGYWENGIRTVSHPLLTSVLKTLIK